MKFAEGDKVVTDSIDIVTKSVVKYMIKSGRKLCTAESCTGGMISQTITSDSGSTPYLGYLSKKSLHDVNASTADINTKVIIFFIFFLLI